MYPGFTATGVSAEFSNVVISGTGAPFASTPVDPGPVSVGKVTVTGTERNPIKDLVNYQNTIADTPRTIQLIATIIPDFATNMTLAWSSSDNPVASVDTTALVTVNTFGNATITATANDGTGFSDDFILIITKFDVPITGQAAFKAMRNSQSGNLGGAREEAVIDRLNSGVRFLEYDLHQDDYKSIVDFQLGESHIISYIFGGPDFRVDNDRPGNPQGYDYRLSSWQKIIVDRSNAHPNHAPITVMYDLKDDFTNDELRPTYYDGLSRLIYHAETTFGSNLFTPQNLNGDQWPTVDRMRGKILCVLSGDTNTRKAYAHNKSLYRQLLFNECRKGEESDSELASSWFYGASNDCSNNVWLTQQNYRNGKIVRARDFDDVDANGVFINHFGL
jgi:hypothetical protein